MGGILAPWRGTASGLAAAFATLVAATPCRAQDRVAALLTAMTEQEKLGLLHGSMAIPDRDAGRTKPTGAIGSAGYVPGVLRLGIPALQETDASLGITNPGDVRPGDTAVALPASVATAASFDPAIAYENGALVGREAASRGFNLVLAGGVNLARQVQGGRDFEYSGEDPLLAGIMVGAAVRGIQDQHVISTVKHFALNDQESQRTTLDVRAPWTAMRQSDLLAFQIAIEQGRPGAVMCAYNKVNTLYACENPMLLNTILKQNWHFPGFVLSDWGGVHGAGAFIAGLDQESAAELDPQPYFAGPLRDLVATGQVPRARLDDAVKRILGAMQSAGLLDGHPRPTVDLKADLATARAAEAASIVLLRNEQAALPLPPTLRTLLVTGAESDAGVPAGGGSSQVTPIGGFGRTIALGGNGPQGYFRVAAFDPPSPLAALRARLPGTRIIWVDGRYPEQAARLARGADAAIVLANQWEGESTDLPSLVLPAGQDGLIDAVAAANRHTIVVLETGGPVLMPWRDKCAAILEAWYGGNGGADALADLLLGTIGPSGRLPITFPASAADLPEPWPAGIDQPPGSAVTATYREGADVGYRWFARIGRAPLFPFGFGLTYTTFRLANLHVSPGPPFTVAFDVTNTGGRPGTDTPQAYAARRGTTVPVLVGWRRVTLRPGETRHVDLTVDPRLLADTTDAGWHIPDGNVITFVGEAAGASPLRAEVAVKAHDLPP